MNRKILLTFDLEEFDLPEEYGVAISKEKQLAVSARGLENLLGVLRAQKVNATFFTTAYYAENNPQQMRELVAEGHEIASHLYYHSDYDPKHLQKSREKLRKITGQEISGFRSPRLRHMDPKLIKAAGYHYHSSLNPTYLPGRYNNLNKPRTLFRDVENELLVLPFSVSPVIRFPLFWLSFKNLNPQFYLTLCRQALRKDGYLHLYFHPWEFTALDEFSIPRYIKNRSGEKLTSQLDQLIQRMKSGGEFETISRFLEERGL